MNFTLLAPEILLTVLAFVIILMGLLVSDKSKNMLGYLSVAGLMACLVYVLGNGMTGKTSYFYDSLVVDPLSQVFKLIFIIVSLIAVIASIEYFKNNRNQDEYYSLLLLSTVGMMVVASANDLITIFVGF